MKALQRMAKILYTLRPFDKKIRDITYHKKHDFPIPSGAAFTYFPLAMHYHQNCFFRSRRTREGIEVEFWRYNDLDILDKTVIPYHTSAKKIVKIILDILKKA